MRYFDEMNNKYGFQDGAIIPQAAIVARQIYVRVLNPLLEKHGSHYRILPFDRGGCHNSLLWLRVPKEYFEQIQTDPQWYENGNHNPSLETNESDEAWDAAIDEAHDLCLDDFYETVLNQLLNQLNNDQIDQVERWFY